MILSHQTGQKFDEKDVIHKQLAELSMAPELFLHKKHTIASQLIEGTGDDAVGADEQVKGGDGQ